MVRTAFLSLILLVSFSSATLLRKSISRRYSDSERCQAIEGFDCKCSPYRLTCSTDRELPQSLNILPHERQKHSSVELLINAERDLNINEYTLEPVKQLFKPDGDNFEFRIKFEKFTALNLNSAGVFNRVFPDNTPESARKHLSLEVYNPQVQPNDNVNLFANLNVDSLELYVLYPFRGTFQQLFAGANIKYLRLSGGDIRSDTSQPFTGNIGRLELAKQSGQLTAQNFPIYPAHELIINAYYVNDFTSDNPPNYSNLGELRVQTQERIPANAFRNFPNLHTLSVTTERDIDPHAFDGLHKLEKLTIKDTKPSLELLNNLPNLKEFETNIEKLDEREQCQLAEKLANGQLAVQNIPSGHHCTCESAYLEGASGRYPCDAQDCDRSSCAVVKNNYDASTRTFKAAPPIQRADGSDAFRPREQKAYNGAYQITHQDQDKAQQSAPSHGHEQSHHQQGSDDDQNQRQPDHYHPDPNHTDGGETVEGNENRDGDNNENRQGGETNNNQSDGDGNAQQQSGDPNQSTDAVSGEATDAPPATKKSFGWLPIILIIAGVVGILLIGLIILILKRRSSAGYDQTATSEHAPARA